MDIITSNNHAQLCGTLAGRPVLSHQSRAQRFYTFPLEVQRLSGVQDRINIVVREELLASLELHEADRLCVTGELRSFNNRRGDGAKLVITVFARTLQFCDEPDENLIHLTGTLCKVPNLRSTPMGRDICDLMLAVNRPYGRSDYLPCICWGFLARQAALWTVGTKLCLTGRIQSRNYVKVTEDGPVERTAFEVSVSTIELPEEAIGET